MPRLALKIEYDGGPFAGWQAQADQPSVQGAVESALGKLDAGFATGARIARRAYAAGVNCGTAAAAVTTA